MIKAMLFIMLVQMSDGQIMYANGLPLSSCAPEVVQAELAKLPNTPPGMNLDYLCVEPGPAPIQTGTTPPVLRNE